MDVNDRINIRYRADAELAGAINDQHKYIEEQTMAVKLESGADEKTNGYEEINLNGKICKVLIEKI